MKQKISIIGVIFGFFLVRAFIPNLIFDPLIEFYHQTNYLSLEFPEVNTVSLLLGMILRYISNALLTFVLIYLWFKDVGLLKMAAVVFVLVIAILLPILVYLLSFGPSADAQTIFYIRKVLIHPIITLILLPALYFYSIQNSSK